MKSVVDELFFSLVLLAVPLGVVLAIGSAIYWLARRFGSSPLRAGLRQRPNTIGLGGVFISGIALLYLVLTGNGREPTSANSYARERVLTALGCVEEFAAAHGGRYPRSEPGGEFSRIWTDRMAKKPDHIDYGRSPWGRPDGPANPTGVNELAPVRGTSQEASEKHPPSSIEALGVKPDHTKSGEILYVQILPGELGDWRAITQTSTDSPVVVRHYAVGIYGKHGEPWWAVNGSR